MTLGLDHVQDGAETLSVVDFVREVVREGEVDEGHLRGLF